MKSPLSFGKYLTVIILISLMAALLPMKTAFGQSNSITVIASADAHVDKSQPDTNFGGKTYLTVDNSPVTRSYVTFNVSDLKGATITAAHIRMYSLYAGANLAVAQANGDFSESGITFNNAPGYGSGFRNISSFNTNTWLDTDVTHIVKGEGRFTFVVTSSSSDAFSIASHERDGGAWGPQLVLTLGSAAPTATKVAPTATKAPTAAPTKVPTKAPTAAPTKVPTKAPTAVPTKAPTKAPTAAPTKVPTKAPTAVPTKAPTKAPTAAPTNPPSSSGPQPYGVSGSWTLKFSDDFNGSSLDLSKWEPNWLAGNSTAITKPINSKELSCYDPAQVKVVNGNLQLSAVARSCKANNGVTYNYASGIVTSRPSYTFNYGYMEARVWVDGSSSINNWPAFWADGTGAWPTTGEIDVFEGLGGKPSWHYHYGSSSSPQQVGGYPTMSTRTGWHIFGADWQPGSIKFYYDGALVGTVSSDVVNSNMFLILNYGLSNSTPVTVPSNFLVDYVRVWQH